MLRSGNEYIRLDLDGNMQLAYTFKLNKVKYSITLLKYDDKMQLVKKTRLSGGDKIYGPFKPVLKRLNNKIWLFYFQLSEEKEVIDIFAVEMNTGQLEINEPRKILSINQKNVGPFKTLDVFYDHTFIIEQSPDHSKTLVLWCSGRNNNLFYSVLDSNMNVLKSKNEEIPGIDKLTIHNACQDNEGNVYAGYGTNGVFVGPIKEEARILSVETGDVKPEQVFVSAGTGKDIIYIAGIYNEGDQKQAGVFSQTLNTNNFALSPAIKSVLPTGIKEKLFAQLKNFLPNEKSTYHEMVFAPLITESGRLHLLLQSKKTVRFTVSGGFGRRYAWGSYVYIHIDSDATVFTRIPKATSPHSSYFYQPFKNKMLLFYNDYKKNLEQDITEGDKPKGGEYISVAAIISENGSLKREIVSEKNCQFRYAERITSSLLLIPSPESYSYTDYDEEIEVDKKSNFTMTTIKIQ